MTIVWAILAFFLGTVCGLVIALWWGSLLSDGEDYWGEEEQGFKD